MARTLKVNAGSDIVFDNPAEVCLVLAGKVKASSPKGQQVLDSGGVIVGSSLAYAVEDAELLFVSLLELQRVKPEMAAKLVRELENWTLQEQSATSKPKPTESGPAENSPAEREQEKKPRYLYESEIKCPVCDQPFKAIKIFETKLQQTGMDKDMRRHFQDFEPLYYRVWVCPSCFYANFSNRYSDLRVPQKEALLATAEEREILLATLPDLGGEIGRAIRDHRLALESLGCIKESYDAVGRAWLDLAWLYEDLGDAEEALAARKKALEGYEQFYLESRSLSPAVEIQVLYIIGDLSKMLGDLKKAHEYLLKAAHFRDSGSAILKELARDGLQELKEMSRHSA